jgi:putative tryptophan/tyrosine transport system substrate-binding protein
MRRREFISLLGGAVVWPIAGVAAAPEAIPRIGILHPGSQWLAEASRRPFLEELTRLGYTEGKSFVLDAVYGNWQPESFRELAAQLVERNADVILVVSTTPARAAKEATSTIPIVVSAMADPVSDGLVLSLAHPGGNVTGNTFLGPELVAKRIGLLKETIPDLSSLAALWHPGAYGENTMAGMMKEVEAAAGSLGLRLQLFPVHNPNEIDEAFAGIEARHLGAFIVLPSPMLFGQHKQIVDIAAKSRRPAIYQAREFVDDGGLMSYGASIPGLLRRSAVYVDRILKGARPADLPVEQPTAFELVINLKTAKAFGLIVPQSLLARADEVIE